jgi:hypothetical protein
VLAAMRAARLLLMAFSMLGLGFSQGESSVTLVGSGSEWRGWSMERWETSGEQSWGGREPMEVRLSGASRGPRYRVAGRVLWACERPAAGHNRVCSLQAAVNHFSTVACFVFSIAKMKE